MTSCGVSNAGIEDTAVHVKFFWLNPCGGGKRSRAYASTSSTAMKGLPLETTRAEKRRRLWRRLMSSPYSQLPAKFSGGNIERDAQPLSRRFAAATATQTALRTGRGVLGTNVAPVGCRHAAHRARFLQPVARRYLTEPVEVPRDFDVRRATTAGGESNLLDWSANNTCGQVDSAESGILPAGSEIATSAKQARRAGATARR
ncbi:hypothetical protein MTO96_016674 [Rhipicephalus appendiculatus]